MSTDGGAAGQAREEGFRSPQRNHLMAPALTPHQRGRPSAAELRHNYSSAFASASSSQVT